MLAKFHLPTRNIKLNFYHNARRFNSLTELYKKSPRLTDFTFELIKTEDYDKAAEYVSKKWMNEGRLMKAYKVKINDETLLLTKHIWLDALQHNRSMIVKLNWDNSIHGVTINCNFIKKRKLEELMKSVEHIRSEEMKHLQEVIRIWDRIRSNELKYPKNIRIYEILAYAFDKNYQHLHIDERLIRESILLAKLSRFDVISVTNTDPVICKIFEKTGFDLMNKSSLNELPNIKKNSKLENRYVYVYNKCVKTVECHTLPKILDLKSKITRNPKIRDRISNFFKRFGQNSSE